MHLAVYRTYRPRISPSIHEEWIAALLKNRRDLSRARLERARDLINQIAADVLVTGYEKFIKDLALPDPDDRHVLAAALHAQADVLVTQNLKDFPDDVLKPLGVAALSADGFISLLLDDDLELVCQAVKDQRLSLKSPSSGSRNLTDHF